MNSVAKRLLLTFTAVPALFIFMFFLPQYDHLAFALLTSAAVALGTHEMQRIFLTRSKGNILYIIASALFPFILYLQKHLGISYPMTTVYGIALLLIFLVHEIFRGADEDFSSSIEHIGRVFLLFFYPGFLSLNLILILFLQNPGHLLLLLFSQVFANDSLAYVFGMLLGKGNRNVLKVSPNKSIAGFIGGILGSMAASLLYFLFSPVIAGMFTFPSLMLLASLVALAGDAGDLVESVFKRSAHVKDSGTAIMGRGGLMDSIDSLLFCAPLFYYLILLFQQGA